MTLYKPFTTSKRNEKLRSFLNSWQKNPDNKAIKGNHRYARPYIPMEINGHLFLMCPDHGNKIKVPSNILNKFNHAD